MINGAAASAELAATRTVEDVCTLPLTRRLAAMLDLDPTTFREGDLLPRGWHVALFNTPTRQSELRGDGAADLGIPLPDLDLPRLMLAGRRIEFVGGIPIGATMRRVSQCGSIRDKHGRSGRFTLVDINHRITVDGGVQPVLLETTSYIMREAAGGPAAASPIDRDEPPPDNGKLVATRTISPDEAMLFRYSAITDNPHRIHYDWPYATRVEGHPSLLVNGSIPTMFLLDMFRTSVGREPGRLHSRNLAPMYCGDPIELTIAEAGDGWMLRATNASGRVAFEAAAE